MPLAIGNPFLRGFHDLCYERILQIHYDDAYPPCYRSLHPAQKQLPDDAVSLQPCLFDDDCAFITAGEIMPEPVHMPSPASGRVISVVYQIIGHQLGPPQHLGDVANDETARHLLEQWSFATGHYSRSWEISCAHLPADEFEYLRQRVLYGSPAGFFECFILPHSHGVGCKLYATPWTMEIETGGSCTAEVHARMSDDHVPSTLLHLLLLAGEADTRFLIFDPDAAPLTELPLFTDH